MNFAIPQELRIFSYFLISLMLSYLLSKLFIKFWISYLDAKETPKGLGFTYSFFLLGYVLLMNSSFSIIVFISLVLLTSLIYVIDDFIGLSPFFRVVLIALFSLGVVLSSELQVMQLTVDSQLVVFLCFFMMMFFLTNAINFYDGADLNLALLIGLYNINLLLLVGSDNILFWASLMSLGFILGFALLNRKPNTLYFGDAGAFVFASYVCYTIEAYWQLFRFVTPLIFVPLMLPSIDVIFTLIYRIYKRENILSRNYYHVYQRWENRFQGKAYLLPQLINFLACHVFFNLYYKNVGEDFFEVACFLITISIFSYVIHMFFCVRNYKHE